MPALRPIVLAVVATLLLGAAGPVRQAPSAPVVMQSNPGTQADRTARQLAAEDIAAARSRGDTPLVLTGRATLGGSAPALLVQLQSAAECGSVGCATSVYSMERGRWQRVLDGATGGLTVSAKKTRGRNDIISEDDHYVWDGKAYVSLKPAPAIDLKPHTAPARRAPG